MTAAKPQIICRGVTSKRWPKEAVASSTSPILSLSQMAPFRLASPGRSMPVFSIIPKASKYS